MRNYTIIASLLLISIMITFSSCRKEDKGPQDYLTEGEWKVTDVELNPGITVSGITITHVFDFMGDECSKDNLFKFNEDGTITEDEGATKCDPSDPQTTTEGTWTLSEDGSSISAVFWGLDTGSADIIILNETTFEFSTTALPDFVAGLGIENQKVKVTMTKQ